jgi:hypothetical protein
MVVLRYQHAFQDINGLSKDRYVNTFHFNWVGEPDVTQIAQVAAEVKSFYTNPHVGGATVSQFLATHVHGPGASVKAYEMTLASTHPPIYEESYTFPDNGQSGSNYPSEVACCLSYSADPVPGVDIRSQRGRLYIGPLNTQAGETGAEEDVPERPGAAFMNTLLAAAQQLKTATGLVDAAWCIYSPKLHHALAPVYSYGVTHAFVDNAFDTQRRRGCAPTARVSSIIT